MSTADAALSAKEAAERETGTSRSLDGWSLALWAAAVLVPAMALPAANWTDDLGLVPVLAAAGLVLGALLVISRFRGAAAIVLAAGYGFVLILWQLTEALDPGLSWRDRAFDLASRVATFVTVVLVGEPSHDSLMFVLAMSLVFWTIAVFGTWWLFRRGGLWLAILLPGVAVFLNVYYYRYGTRLQIYLPVFLLVVLALIVRVELNGRRRDWEQRRAQVSTDVSSRVTQAGIIAALLLVLLAWMGPRVSDTQVETAAGLTGARSPLGDLFSDVLAGLRSPVNLYGETFASTLELGAGRLPGDRVVFQATALGEVPEGSRVYWRARAYDTYRNRKWEVTLGDSTVFRPRQGDAAEPTHAGRVELEFIVSSFMPALKLLYLPAEIAWINRSADLREVTEQGAVVDVLEATSAETLLPGDSYRVRSRLAAPLAGDLRQAGADYPAWVEDKYLHLPPGFSRRVERLANEITADVATPYDKTEAIITWLRSNIRYQREIGAPPEGQDPVEWFLFDSRVGFCDYYASAAVLMLRSEGVPSRLAAGFAEGAFDAETHQYLVSEADLHSWPEVYFPGYGWVEFEPTVSQPVLERTQGQSAEGEQGGAGPEETSSGAASGAAGGLASDSLDQLADIEDIQIPETTVRPTPWFGYGLLALAFLALVIYVTPARRVAARWTVAGTRKFGLAAPSVFQEWAEQPTSEASTVFRRLAPWVGRLGGRLERDATPSDRGRAVAGVIPEQEETIAAIVEAYNTERYGGVAGEKGQASAAWYKLRPNLYRARLTRLVDSILRPGAG